MFSHLVVYIQNQSSTMQVFYLILHMIHDNCCICKKKKSKNYPKMTIIFQFLKVILPQSLKKKVILPQVLFRRDKCVN